LTIEGKEVQLRRSVFNMDTTDIAPGTPPKQHTTFNHICASCHNGRGANPSDSALQTGTARPNMHESNQFNMLVGIGGVESVTGGQDPHCLLMSEGWLMLKHRVNASTATCLIAGTP